LFEELAMGATGVSGREAPLRVREEIVNPPGWEEKIRRGQRKHLLRGQDGGLLARVLEKEGEPPVSLLMVLPDLYLFGEMIYCADAIDAYVQLGVERFLDDSDRRAGGKRLALPIRGIIEETAAAFEDGWGAERLRCLFLWPWPEHAPFCNPSSFISPAWGETHDGLLPASSTGRS
jgi:hypothetical protein